MTLLHHRTLLAVAAALAMLCASPSSAASSSTGIVAIVNGLVISDFDLEQRVQLFSALTGTQITPESRARIRAQVLASLEDEVIQMQEGARRKIPISNDEINREISVMAARVNLPPQQIVDAVKQAGVSTDVLGRQVAARLIWRKLVNARYRADTQMSEAERDEAADNYLRDLRRAAMITVR